jgi:AcrR family transcriptional regulator
VSNPLFDTLFRPTTSSPIAASAAPVRAQGTHSRAGNAMNRTRAALLSGAALAVEATGTKITMAQVAAAAGVAKATLYNHFRTREAVLAALLLDQVRRVVDDQDGAPLDVALAGAATAISSNPVRRGLARVEPAALARLGCVDPNAEAWQLAYAGVGGALAAAGLSGVDTVVRWLASFLLTPATPEQIRSDVAVLVRGLPRVQGQPRYSSAGASAAPGPSAASGAGWQFGHQ